MPPKKKQSGKLSHANSPPKLNVSAPAVPPPPTKMMAWPVQLILRLSPNARRAWGAFLAIGAVIGLISAVVSLLPGVSIEQDIPLKQQDPFSTQFRFKNEGPFSIHDVSFRCVSNVTTGRDLTINGNSINLGPVETQIESKESATRSCTLTRNTRLSPDNVMTKMEVLMMATYRPRFWPWMKTNGERFVGVPDDAGIFHWTHQPFDPKQFFRIRRSVSLQA
jgi:hypothetical protein